MNVKIKRVYEQPDKDDGIRALVDRLWPRRLTHEKAHIDLWLKDIAPSTQLRKSFGHDPEKWDMFKEQYVDELKINGAQIALLREQIQKDVVTLVFGAKDRLHNEAVVLKEYINQLR